MSGYGMMGMGPGGPMGPGGAMGPAGPGGPGGPMGPRMPGATPAGGVPMAPRSGSGTY